MDMAIGLVVLAMIGESTCRLKVYAACGMQPSFTVLPDMRIAERTETEAIKNGLVDSTLAVAQIIIRCLPKCRTCQSLVLLSPRSKAKACNSRALLASNFSKSSRVARRIRLVRQQAHGLLSLCIADKRSEC